jgi:hypothetical protein
MTPLKRMNLPLTSPLFPKHVWALLALYFAASLLHFSHNAEYIAFYPNMPRGLSRETVYLAWLAFTSAGVAAILLSRFGWRVAGALCLAAYGALGLDGLGHYALALCSQHTLAMNLTIWFEVASGAALALFALAFAWGRARAAPSA